MSLFSRTVRPASPTRVARVRDLVVVNSIEAFTLETGHPMRGAQCMLCHHLIGGDRVAIIGLGGLAGEACPCGAIPADLFLIHAAHFPVQPDVISTGLRRALTCRAYHPAHD